MMDWRPSRRGLLLGGWTAATFAAAAGAAAEEPDPGALDEFIGRYMREMGAPGLTLALADRKGVVRTASFGFSEIETRTPVTPEHLFQIGSISKSFTALTVLRLREEGKIDLDAPILEYLPWLPIETNHGTVTVHHLLTHTSGLPNTLCLFSSDPAARLVQAFRPGSHFDYCNLGFEILGHLLEKAAGKPWPAVIAERIFAPLGMASSQAAITMGVRAKLATGYRPYDEGSVYLRRGRLAPAGGFVFENAAGSIVSTPGDMARYLHMLLNRGAAPHGRIVSEESFALFSKPYILAPEFSATAHYGYGIAVDRLDGHTVLRHTGGMVSFMSAMHVDLDGGVAAFASINAQQGYRPNPVTEYAVRRMRAERENKPAPAPPAIASQFVIENAAGYAGVYESPEGERVEVSAQEDGLAVTMGGKVFRLASSSSGLVADAAAFQEFPFVFGRAGEGKGSDIVELGYGSRWYANGKYKGNRQFALPAEYAPFEGAYRAESAWAGSARVVGRKGKLWLDGSVPLEPLGDSLFRVGAAPSAETAQFLYLANGRTRMLKLSGMDLWRIETA
jgi:CubicO group peptidase (beta-lactamase class C family)